MSDNKANRWFELDAGSYLPLPWFPYEERPHSMPLDVEECATALFLKKGDVGAAAERLRVTVARLNRTIRKSPRLIRLQTRLTDARARGWVSEPKPATGAPST
jgi:hypothetical protein